MLYVFMYRPCVRGGSCVGANLHRVEPLSNVSHLKRVPTLGPASCRSAVSVATVRGTKIYLLLSNRKRKRKKTKDKDRGHGRRPPIAIPDTARRKRAVKCTSHSLSRILRVLGLRSARSRAFTRAATSSSERRKRGSLCSGTSAPPPRGNSAHGSGELAA